MAVLCQQVQLWPNMLASDMERLCLEVYRLMRTSMSVHARKHLSRLGASLLGPHAVTGDETVGTRKRVTRQTKNSHTEAVVLRHG